jgi:hypothetical protein
VTVEAFLLEKAVELASAIISFTIGMWIFNKWILPRMAPGMVKGVIETKEVQDLLKKGKDTLNDFEKRGKEMLSNLEPFAEKLKGLDLEQIDGEMINALLKQLKKIADQFTEKPELPELQEPTS